MKNRFKTILYILCFVTLTYFSISCSKTVYIPIENIRTEYKDKLQRDSIFLHDSILIKAINDTIWIEKYQYKYRDRLVRDSVFINDTIRIPYPVIEYKEVHKLKGWQNFLVWMGGIALLIIVFRIIKKTP